jgi:hypothetical protein
MARTTLRTKLGNQTPDEDGRYTIRQVAEAIYGGLQEEKLAMARSQREMSELKLGRAKAQYVDAHKLALAVVAKLVAAKTLLEDTHITDEEYATILFSFRGVMDAFEDAIKESQND